MSKRKKSLISSMVFMMVVQCALLLIVFFSYIYFSYHTILQDLQTNNENLMQIYGKELENKLVNADMLLERLIYKNHDYNMLQSESEANRYYASVQIKKFIQEQITYDRYVDAVVIAESTYGACLDYENTEFTLNEREALREFSMNAAKQGRAKAEWDIAQIGFGNYIYKMYVWQGKSAGIFISVDHFMGKEHKSDFENVEILLSDDENYIWGKLGKKQSQWKIGEFLDESAISRLAQKTRYELADGKILITEYVSISEIFGQIRWSMVLVFLVILILAGFSGILIYFLRKEMITPMSHMQKSMETMQQGNYELRISEDYNNREFALWKDTFNRLMDEIVGLKIQSYEKQIDLQETELKCMKLQIRPHFFLNAMTTISSLSQQRKNAEIEKYINALSKNIRYMFRSGLHTVTLQEEVSHVENYFEMQELKYPGCVFYYIDIPPELEDWKIPQMVIHTIIENEYKYAVDMNQMLTILIKAAETEIDGEKMLLLEIEDDGKGYPEEVLEVFAGGRMMTAKNGERVGLQSVKRMMELMYEREGLFQISNTELHGCKNTFWIPEHVVQEVKEQAQIKLD